MFQELFGFSAPPAVKEIKYRDVYNRHLLDGAWGRWISFTYEPQVFSNIVAQRGFKLTQHAVTPTSGADPSWWPASNGSFQLYERGEQDTPENEGFSFREYVWRDTNVNFVFFHKYHWD